MVEWLPSAFWQAVHAHVLQKGEVQVCQRRRDSEGTVMLCYTMRRWTLSTMSTATQLHPHPRATHLYPSLGRSAVVVVPEDDSPI
jgi:hypothetical protein